MPVIPLKLLSYDDAQDIRRVTDVVNENFRYLDWLINHRNLDNKNIRLTIAASRRGIILDSAEMFRAVGSDQYEEGEFVYDGVGLGVNNVVFMGGILLPASMMVRVSMKTQGCEPVMSTKYNGLSFVLNMGLVISAAWDDRKFRFAFGYINNYTPSSYVYNQLAWYWYLQDSAGEVLSRDSGCPIYKTGQFIPVPQELEVLCSRQGMQMCVGGVAVGETSFPVVDWDRASVKTVGDTSALLGLEVGKLHMKEFAIEWVPST